MGPACDEVPGACAPDLGYHNLRVFEYELDKLHTFPQLLDKSFLRFWGGAPPSECGESSFGQRGGTVTTPPNFTSR